MPSCLRLQQRVEQTAFDTKFGRSADADFLRNLIRRFKADPVHFRRQPVRVFAQNRVDIRSITVKNPYRHAAGYAIFLQKNKGIPQVDFLMHLHGNIHRLFGADAFYPGEQLRFFFDDSKSIRTENFHDLRSQCLPDSFDGAACQIPLHCLRIIRYSNRKTFRLHLLPVNRMLNEGARYRNRISDIYSTKRTDHSNLLSFCLEREYRVSVLFITVDHIFDKALDLIHGCDYIPIAVMKGRRCQKIKNSIGIPSSFDTSYGIACSPYIIPLYHDQFFLMYFRQSRVTAERIMIPSKTNCRLVSIPRIVRE